MSYSGDLSALTISVLTGVFLILSFIFFFLIVLKKVKQLNEDIIRKKYWIKIQDHLAHILIQSALNVDGDWDYKKSVRILKKSVRRSRLIKQWLLDEMIQQRSNLSGEAHTTLMRIYSELDFKSFSLNKLKRRNWFKVAQGIKELEQMQQHDCFTHFYKFLDSRNRDLRKVARMGLTALAPQPLSFLEHLNEELTEWEQMNIASRLSGKSAEQLPKFYKYYRHSQPSVAAFCVRMSVKFGCYNHIPLLINLLIESNKELQAVIINGLTELGAFQAYDSVYEVAFCNDHVDKEVLIASLKFIGEMGSEKDENLIEKMLNHEDMEIRMQAVSSAIKLDLDLSEYPEEILRMSQHYHNELIS